MRRGREHLAGRDADVLGDRAVVQRHAVDLFWQLHPQNEPAGRAREARFRGEMFDDRLRHAADVIAEDLSHPPKLMLVTPSHQYPLGMVMSLARRRMLLEYARQHRCWVIEDDYDSEFRYGSRPLASLQGLDTAGQVIYVGSFGKTLFPGLRIGYIVVPEALSASFATASAELYREGQLLQQAVLAEFIAEGHFTSHIRRMRALYGQRRELMLATIAKRYGDRLAIVGGDAGLHLVLRLPDGVDDRAVASEALAENIVVRPLSGYFARRDNAGSGLLIGYACVPDEDIEPAFETLAGVIDRFLG